MSPATPSRDLVVLVADKNMEAAMRALLKRRQAIGIRPVESEIYVHPDRDPGCLLRAHEFLRAQSMNFSRALVVLDRHGCGSPNDASELEAEIEDRLSSAGWGDRAHAIVIDPELEVWVWSDSPHVDEVLGWSGQLPALRDWLALEGYTTSGAGKPHEPKAAMEAALREVRKPRSSAIYAQLAERVGLERCRDRAFGRLRQVLRGWFGPGPSASAATIV